MHLSLSHTCSLLQINACRCHPFPSRFLPLGLHRHFPLYNDSSDQLTFDFCQASLPLFLQYLPPHPTLALFIDGVTVVFRIVAFLADDILVALRGGQNLLKLRFEQYLCHHLDQFRLLEQHFDIQRLLDMFLAPLTQP